MMKTNNLLHCSRMVFVVILSLIAITGCVSKEVKSNFVPQDTKEQAKLPALAENKGPEDEFKLALDLVKLAIEDQQYDRAESLLHKLRKIKREDPRVYRMLAQTYEAQSKLEMAFLGWIQVNELKEKTVEDESELARLALLNNRYHMAELIYTKWLGSSELNQQISALNNLGFSALLQKKYSKAQSFFYQALKKDPLNQKALSNLQLVNVLME